MRHSPEYDEMLALADIVKVDLSISDADERRERGYEESECATRHRPPPPGATCFRPWGPLKEPKPNMRARRRDRQEHG